MANARLKWQEKKHNKTVDWNGKKAIFHLLVNMRDRPAIDPRHWGVAVLEYNNNNPREKSENFSEQRLKTV